MNRRGFLLGTAGLGAVQCSNAANAGWHRQRRRSCAAPQPVPVRFDPWYRFLRPNFQGADFSSKPPNAGGATANVNGRVSASTYLIQPDAGGSANEAYASWVWRNMSMPYDSEDLTLIPKVHRTGGVDLKLSLRSIVGTLDLRIYQTIFIQLFLWNGTAWDDLGMRESTVFDERRNYGVGEGGDDDRTWPKDDDLTFNAFYERAFSYGQVVQVLSGIRTGVSWGSSGYAITARNIMTVDTAEVAVIGYGS